MKAPDAPMTRHLVEAGVFKGSPFGLVDVGASGGIDARWSIFGGQLRGWGFDPLEGEVERLNAEAPKGVTYHAGWVGYKQYAELLARVPYARPDRPDLTNDPCPRLSIWKAMESDDHLKRLDSSGSGRYAERRIDLDDFFAADERRAVDFLKIDTDGHDYEVLLGAAALLRDAPVVGVQAECVFHGPLHPRAHVFGNLDQLLREAGFSLFDMWSWRYSRAALPSRFLNPFPAQTERGQLWWGDFLYLRDFADPAYEESWGLEPAAMKLLKLACCFETYDLADCAAEVLLKYQERLRPLVDLDRCLDLLTAGVAGDGVPYRQHLDQFRREPRTFYAGYEPPARVAAARDADGAPAPRAPFGRVLAARLARFFRSPGRPRA